MGRFGRGAPIFGPFLFRPWMPLFRSRVAFLAGGLAISLVVSSCDVIAPERTLNAAAAPPTVEEFEAFRDDLFYAGEIELEIPDALSTGARVVLFIDGEIVDECVGPNCSFRILTSDYEDGPHEVAITYLPPDGIEPSVGLGSLLGLGRVLFRDTVQFDQTPPTPVQITNGDWTEEGIRLRWESPPGANRNARAYNVFTQHPDQDGFPISLPAPAEEVLDDRVPLRMGDVATYRVSVTNGASPGGAGPFATSEPYTVTASPEIGDRRFCGEDVSDPVLRFVPFATVPGSARLLGLCYMDRGVAVRALDLTTQVYGPLTTLPAPPQGSSFGFDLVSDPSGVFAIIGRSGSVPIRYVAALLDPSTLTLGPWVELVPPGGWGLNSAGGAVGPDGRLYVKDETEVVHVFDPTDGSHLQSLLAPLSPRSSTRVLSRVGREGLLVYRPGEIVRIDMAARPARVTAMLPRSSSSSPRFVTDANGLVYRFNGFSSSDRMDVVDPVSLRPLRSFTVAGGVPVTQVWGDLDGVYAFTPLSGRGGEIVRLRSDGTEIGRRLSVHPDVLIPTPTPGSVFFVWAGRPASIDTIP